MRQFKISHPGEIVGRDLADMGVSGRHFANNIGVTPATVSRFLAGKTALTPQLAIRIAAALGSTPEFWLRMQSAYDLRKLENEVDTTGITLYGEDMAAANEGHH